MKVAIVHDCLIKDDGGIKTLNTLCEIFPDASIYTLFSLSNVALEKQGKHPVYTSFLQKLPKFKGRYSYLYPLMPIAVEGFDFSDYDLVVTTGGFITKGILVPMDTCHIWYGSLDSNDTLKNASKSFSPIRTFLRMWDSLSSTRNDAIIVDSLVTKEEIQNRYRRKSAVITLSDKNFKEPLEKQIIDIYTAFVNGTLTYE